jgi:mono/diheme cytochrome c family protein
MRAPSAHNLAIRKALFAILLGIVAIAVVTGILENRPWTVPEEAKQRRNPLEPSESNLKSARAVFLDKCANCHGEAGKGDGHDASLYDPAPSNFTDAQHMHRVTDGEMFYKISEGRKPMPAFKKKLTEPQRWELILLIRSFAGKSAEDDRSEGTPN